MSTLASVTAIIPMTLIMAAGMVGCAIGTAMPLARNGARPLNRTLRFVQDLLAYDFYMDKVYDLTFVALVASAAKLLAWVDRYVVDGLVNFAGLAMVFGGQGLRYSASGQSQLYVVTMLVGVGALLLAIAPGQISGKRSIPRSR